MKNIKAMSKILNESTGKKCLALLLVLVLVFTTIPVSVEAAAENGWSLYVCSPLEQVLNLTEPSAVVPGGRGYMVPQQVAVVDANGRSVIGAEVTFEVSTNDYVTSVMRGINKRTITVYTNENGIASAASTDPQYLGEGFQVYSKWANLTQGLEVKAKATEVATTVVFKVKVNTYGRSPN